jgi:alpha-ketoglutarate-dependent 2,4-dichlorophenoxyacetate dioxygenase
MTFRLWPITESFGAEVEGVDLRTPPAGDTLAALENAFARYAVLVFPEQALTPEQHSNAAAAFGPLEPMAKRLAGQDKAGRLMEHLIDVSNLTNDDRPWDADSRSRAVQLGNQLWHTDSSFKFVPARASFLYGRAIPAFAGQTEFADLRAAWDALDEPTKAMIDGKVAFHSLMTSRRKTGFGDFTPAEAAAMQPVPQVLVRRLPQSGRRSLYLASHIGAIAGMDDTAAQSLVDRLVAHATQRQFVYTHRWRAGDLVMWDNRCTMHRVKPFDDLQARRDLQRATVLDTANSCELMGIALP